MSVIPCPRSISCTSSMTDYLELGEPDSPKYWRNKREGTNRVAAMTNDCGTIDEFVREAEMTAQKHGRRVESISLVQSFPRHEFDPAVPDDIRRANDYGYMLSKRNWKDAKSLVVTHADAEHVHNHIITINDDGNGHALRRTHWKMIVKENDALMRGLGLEVAVPAWKREYGRDWAELRESKSEFDKQLGDKIADALKDRSLTDERSFFAALDDVGVTVEEKVRRIHASADGEQPAHDSVGWTYRMYDDTEGTKDRYRRRAASTLSKEFTRDEVRQVLDIKRQLATGIEQQPEQEIHHEHQGRHAGRAAEQPDAGASAATTRSSTGEQPGDSHESALDIAKRVARERDAKRRRDERDGSAERADGSGRGTDRDRAPEPDSAGQRAGREDDDSFFRRTPSRRQGRARGRG